MLKADPLSMKLSNVISAGVISAVIATVFSVPAFAHIPTNSKYATLGVTGMPTMHSGAAMYMVKKFTITKEGSPLANVIVTISDQQGVTNGQGVVALDNIMQGDQVLYTYYNHEDRMQHVMIGDADVPVQYEKGQVLASNSFMGNLYDSLASPNIF